MSFSHNLHTVRRHQCVERRCQSVLNFPMLHWCVLHLFWYWRLWCCCIDPWDDLAYLLLLPPCIRCSDCVISLHTALQLHPAIGFLVRCSCWRDWWIFGVLPHVDLVVAVVMHWSRLLVRLVLSVVNWGWHTLLLLMSCIGLPSRWGWRSHVPRLQGWWGELRRCHTWVDSVDWCSHSRARLLLVVGFFSEILRRCRQWMSASPLWWCGAIT